MDGAVDAADRSATILKAAPVWLRSRLLLRLARALVRNSYQRQPRDLADAARHRQHRPARVDLLHRCASRSPHPLCGFYAAAFTRLLALFDIGARTEVVACRGTGEPTCVLKVALANGQPADGQRPS